MWETCPLCGELFFDYVTLNSHITTHKKGQLEAHKQEVNRALDPFIELNELYNRRTGHGEQITIGQFFGDIITSRFDHHAMLTMIGKTGSGKSTGALYVAEQVSHYVAKKMGGKPEDYFTIENVAVMILDTIIPILKSLDKKKHSIFILDDIGGEYSARDFMKKQNKEINKILQTFRDSNTLLIFTVPNAFLLDIVGRKLAHFQVEMVTQVYTKSVSIGKIHKLVESYHKNKTLYPFPVYNDIQYTRIMFRKPSQKLLADYDRKRRDIRKAFTLASI